MPAASPARAAREALAARLREIREDAGLTGRELAAFARWHPSKVSKIERGARPPSRSDLEVWAKQCGAEALLADLLAALRSVATMYVEYRARGQCRIQEERVDQYERTRLFRIYEPDVVPGLFPDPGLRRGPPACGGRVPGPAGRGVRRGRGSHGPPAPARLR